VVPVSGCWLDNRRRQSENVGQSVGCKDLVCAEQEGLEVIPAINSLPALKKLPAVNHLAFPHNKRRG